MFVPQDGGYKLAAFVQQSANKRGRWPALCTTKESTTGASIAPSQVPAELAAALARDSDGRANDTSAVAPFALNQYTDIYGNLQLSPKDTATGDSESTTFSPTAYPSYSFPYRADGDPG